MRYKEFLNIPEALVVSPRSADSQKKRARRSKKRVLTPDQQDALEQLQALNRRRIESLADQVHRELRRYMTAGELVRHELESRLGDIR
ncbi:hypothetical protein FN976_28470 [Caenimonas sedimenti]|uniref:Uncharacterized protein n=1 Tax=Caenimonas sedimenti TaxID=2596921 RepID=A0A562ZD40_9BURK|nr:hypothetical protein [Caenimonas sedimenti]TWO63639.1 hypothetical protein FN976_28470 [Caenimonas sedimenti]